jgi:SAM-dependent methyltransferase
MYQLSKMDIKAIGKLLGPRFDAVAGDGARALNELAPEAAIQDIGTGNGNFAIYRVLTGEPMTDRSHYAGKDWALNAKKAGILDKIRFEAFDASQLPFESEVFDAVFFFGVLHHVSEHLRGDVFREALRVSKQNGAVVFFEPRMETLQIFWVDDPDHPLAANPSNYLPDASICEYRIEGSFMDIFIYKKAMAFPPRRRTLPIGDRL